MSTSKYNYHKQSIFTKIDIFGIGYNFLINGESNYKTSTGSFLTLLYAVISVALFFGFGMDLYQRKRPKVSLNSQVGEYSKVMLSNQNFTYAYRVEDRHGLIVTDRSLVYQQVIYYHVELVNGVWTQVFLTVPENKRCRELPYVSEKEQMYNISLENWYCIDFDNITMGGNWDGNFAYGYLINTMQCSSLNGDTNCMSQKDMQTNFQDELTSGNLFFSDLSIEVLPSMDDFEHPLRTSLVNRYEMLSLDLTKRKVQTFQFTSVINCPYGVKIKIVINDIG